MNILVYSSLYPNSLQPNFGIFIKKRMLAVHSLENCKITVVAPIPYCPEWKLLHKWNQLSKLPRYEVMDGVEVFHPRYFLLPKVSMLFQGASMFLFSLGLIKKLHKKNKFRVIDGHFIYPDCFAAILTGKCLKLPVVVSARGSDIHTFPRYPMIRPLVKMVLNAADRIISVCTSLKDTMIKLGAEEKRISVIPNGVDKEIFNRLSPLECRKKLGLDLKKKIILSVGSLTPNKGFHLIIEALSLLSEKLPSFHYYIIGVGDEQVRLKRLIGKYNLKDHVTLVGSVPNERLALWYNAADVFCIASQREGWANVLMESLACGTPVVATNVGGASEIIKSPAHGALVDRDPVEIAEGLRKSLEDDKKGKMDIPIISERSWDDVAIEIRTIFDEILA